MPAPSPLSKLGTWNAATNTPTLPNVPTLTAGQYYECSADGTFLGILFQIGDYIYARDGSYQRLDANDPYILADQQVKTGLMNRDWQYVILGSTFTTGSSSAVNVTGLSFAPEPSFGYEVEGILNMRTTTATVMPRPGIAWPSNLTDGTVMLDISNSTGTSRLFSQGNINASVLGPVGGLPDTTGSWPCKIHVMFFGAAGVTGNFQIQIASETNGTNVSVRVNSFIRYRKVSNN